MVAGSSAGAAWCEAAPAGAGLAPAVERLRGAPPYLYSVSAATREGVDRPTGPAKRRERDQRRLVSPMRELERNLPDAAAPRADQFAVPPLAVIGAGRAGRSIAVAARRARLPVELAGRDRALDACRRAGVALLCVPDLAIADACVAVAAAVPPLRFVGHVS